MRIIQINHTTFNSKNYVLYFDTENLKIADDGITPLYPFVVKDQPELTEKLRAAVKRKFLAESNFYMGAISLLKLLERGNLEPLITEEVFADLCKAFEEKYGSKPEFSMRDYGTLTRPKFSAKIIYTGLEHIKPAKARTANQARAKVLQVILRTE